MENINPTGDNNPIEDNSTNNINSIENINPVEDNNTNQQQSHAVDSPFSKLKGFKLKYVN